MWVFLLLLQNNMKQHFFQSTQKIRNMANTTYIRMKLELTRRTRKEALIEYATFLSMLFILVMLLLFLVKARTDSIELGYKIAIEQKKTIQLQKDISLLQYEYNSLLTEENLNKENEKFKLVPAEKWTPKDH